MGNPLRVLHVVVNMNRGGAETLLMNLYRNIDRSKVQFDFLTSKEGVFDPEIREMGGQIYRIPYISEVGHTNYVKKLNQFFKENAKYKIVHSHMDKMSGLILLAAKKAGIPVRIAHSHNTRSEGGLPSQLYKWYSGKKINLSATHSFACSTDAAKWLFKKNHHQAHILKNGIECKKFQFSMEIRREFRKKLGIHPGCLVIGHIGRFNHQKNHNFLLEIFAEVIKKYSDTQLILIGDGLLRREVESKIKELNLEKNVKLLGVREDIHRLLQAFDLFVFPSLHEGLPVTLIEAQAAGLPCIIADTITKEVDMEVTKIAYLSLRDKNLWVKTILHLAKQNLPRKISEKTFNQQGYNIQQTAGLTQEMYLVLGGQSSENSNRVYSNV